jgi:hypothetical protein
MSAHTPGPWTVDRIAVLDEFSKAVALAVPRSMEYCTYANARLIAAAPELLEALKAALPWIETCEEGEEATRIGWAAIAKATGEPT